MNELFARSTHRICEHGLSSQTRRVFKAQTRTNSKKENRLSEGAVVPSMLKQQDQRQ